MLRRPARKKPPMWRGSAESGGGCGQNGLDGAYTVPAFGAACPAQTAKIVAIGAGKWKRGFIQGSGKQHAP
ncbi:hypothetical protein IR141_13110, partial [Neisseria sp. 19428wB4_WF04]